MSTPGSSTAPGSPSPGAREPGSRGPDSPDATPQGVIHDIGYRHYEGPRLGVRQVIGSLYLDTLRGSYGFGRSIRSKIVPAVLFALACLPALIIVVIVNVTGDDELPIPYSGYAWILQTVVGLYVAGQAPQAVSRDLRYGVIPLYFSRPLRRDDYLLAKFAALTTAVFAFLAIPLVILYVGALLAELPVWEQTAGFLVALAGAVLLAVLLTGIGLVIAAVTPRRGLGVAAIITVLLVTSSVSGVVQGIATSEGHSTLARYGAMLSPNGLVDGVLVWLFHAEPSVGEGPPGTLGGIVFLVTTLLVIIVCHELLRARYRKVSVS